MSVVSGLGYLGVGTDDLEGWRSFGAELLGLQLADPPVGEHGDDALYFRIDSRAYRLVVEAGQESSLLYAGYEVASYEELSALESRLLGAGFEVTLGDSAACAHRRVGAMISTTDPAGFGVEFFVGHQEESDQFVSPTGARFVVGELGMGHAVCVVPDLDKQLAFYVGLLGFRMSDTIEFGRGAKATFLHCNPRHHTLALVERRDIGAHLNHIMFEVEGLDTVGYAYDRVRARDVPIVSTLGRHTNDEMLSFYCTSPSGFAVEYGMGGRLIDDDTWVVRRYGEASSWGHKKVSGPLVNMGA